MNSEQKSVERFGRTLAFLQTATDSLINARQSSDEEWLSYDRINKIIAEIDSLQDSVKAALARRTS